MAPTLKYVTVEVVEKPVALLKLNKPNSGNSVEPQLLSDMVAALKWANDDTDIRIIVLTGAGKFFSTGMHLAGPEDLTSWSFMPGGSFHELNRALITSEKILIAAVNGPAAGYGVSSLALFDLVYSVPDAYFFTPFVKWGMAAEGASSVSFPRIMGHQKAAALFLAAERITAQEADKLGLVTKIMPKEDFLSNVIQIATQIAEAPPGSLRATKELMRQPVRELLLEANDRECAFLRQQVASGEPQRAIEKFQVEKERKRKDKSRL